MERLAYLLCSNACPVDTALTVALPPSPSHSGVPVRRTGEGSPLPYHRDRLHRTLLEIIYGVGHGISGRAPTHAP